MTDNLGYPRFAAQGGDIGAGVTSWLGYAHAANLYGIHLTSITCLTPYLGPDATPLTAAEQALIDQRARWQQAEGGYAHIQGMKPQTLAYGLNDSPAGLAAWIAEKYRTWSDFPATATVEARYTKDELLTIVTLCTMGDPDDRLLHPNVFGEPAQPVAEGQRRQGPGPGGMAMFPQEIARPPREWGERSVPYSALGTDAQRRPLRRLGRDPSCWAGGPRLLSAVSWGGAGDGQTPVRRCTMPWAHAPEHRRGAPSPGGPNTISPQEGSAWTQTQSTSTSMRK